MPDTDRNSQASAVENSPERENQLVKPFKEKRLLSPTERVVQIIYGIIMALTFTGTMSVANADKAEVREMLIAALGCNIAWGFVDAVIYILTCITVRYRGRTIMNFLQKDPHSEEAKKFIAESLPPIVVSSLSRETFESICRHILDIPQASLRVRITSRDILNAGGIFLFVFISTFPVAIPFLFIQKVHLALRISNAIAIVIMFICGWLLGRFGGFSKILTGLALALVGGILVFTTIALGG